MALNAQVPKSLLPELEEIRRNPPAIPGFTMDRLCYLIYLIVSHRQEPHPGSYSVLNMEYLENIVPKAHLYLKFLRDSGIIEWKNHANYEGMRHSRLYRLIPKHEGETVYRTLIDKKLAHSVELHHTKVKKQNSRAYPQLNRWVYKVRINEAEAHETVEREYKKNIQRGKLNAARIRTFGHDEIDKIVRKQIYIRVNKTNGRFDTNYTRLPGYLVPFLSIDGQPLIELDIACSQPFFAASLFNPTPEVRAIMNKFSLYQKYGLIISDKQDVNKYTKLVTSGQFYDYMMREFNEAGIAYIDRRDFKEKLFLVFFGRVDTKYTSRAVRLFSQLFPTVQGLFNEVKSEQHNQLAILLQKIESYTMLRRVAPAIKSKFPELPILTKHDSLLPAHNMTGLILPGSCVDEVRKIIQDEIERTTGLRPLVRIKGKTEPQARPIQQSDNSITQYISLITLNLYTPLHLYHYIRKPALNALILN